MSLFDLFDAENVQFDERSVQTIKDAENAFIEQRNDFQQRVSASEIKRIEGKMLPSPNGRSRDETCMSALTKEERLIYADFLESVKNQPLGASVFRNYEESVKSEKKKVKKKGSKF